MLWVTNPQLLAVECYLAAVVIKRYDRSRTCQQEFEAGLAMWHALFLSEIITFVCLLLKQTGSENSPKRSL